MVGKAVPVCWFLGTACGHILEPFRVSELQGEHKPEELADEFPKLPRKISLPPIALKKLNMTISEISAMAQDESYPASAQEQKVLDNMKSLNECVAVCLDKIVNDDVKSATNGDKKHGTEFDDMYEEFELCAATCHAKHSLPKTDGKEAELTLPKTCVTVCLDKIVIDDTMKNGKEKDEMYEEFGRCVAECRAKNDIPKTDGKEAELVLPKIDGNVSTAEQERPKDKKNLDECVTVCLDKIVIDDLTTVAMKNGKEKHDTEFNNKYGDFERCVAECYAKHGTHQQADVLMRFKGAPNAKPTH